MGNLASVRGDIKINTRITSAHGNVTPEAKLTLDTRATFDSATGTYQVTDSISGGANTIDLVGTLVDDLGDSVVFDKVHCIHVHSTSASSSTMAVSTNFDAVNDVDLLGGSHITWINEKGVSLTGGASDTITITGTNGNPYDLVVIGLKS